MKTFRGVFLNPTGTTGFTQIILIIANLSRYVHMRYYKIPAFIKFLIELAAAVPVHRYT